SIDPEIDHIQKIISYFRVLKVQVNQFKAVSPGFIAKTIIVGVVPSKVNTLVPSAVRRMFPVPLNILEGKKFSSCMVENSVYHYPNIQVMCFFYKFCKVLIVSQSSVYHFIVSGIISVSSGLKKR